MRALLVLGIGLFVSGCQTASYYKQAIQGQYQILAERQPMSQLLADPKTPAELKEKFRLVLKLREYARDELRLPIDGHYLLYADLHRRFVVWNVHAALEFSLEPKTWWYPVVGRHKYRGFFSEEAARRYGDKLTNQGLDVYVGGVEAYSTLGWFKDPVLNTFIHHVEYELAETLFHELAHQRLFINGDTDFNEAFATAVAEEGVRRWMSANTNAVAYEKYQAELKRNGQFVALVTGARDRLKPLYGDTEAELSACTGEKVELPAETKRAQKDKIIRELREDYATLKKSWGNDSGYDRWFQQPINNAKLNTISTYYHLVPAFHTILRASGGDWEKFYRDVSNLSRLSKKERHARLEELLMPRTVSDAASALP